MRSLCPSFFLETEIEPEKYFQDMGYFPVAGVDEAGRGPLAGPVVAAAVIFKKGWRNADIRDSKKLSESRRYDLYNILAKEVLCWNWALVEAEEIDRINILNATLLAMKKAVETLPVKPGFVIIDGKDSINTPLPQSAIIKGDFISPLIGAASIMAKVVRDNIMKKYHVLYPQYDFAAHKGYGTRKHIDALNELGCSPFHRKSFKTGRFSTCRD